MLKGGHFLIFGINNWRVFLFYYHKGCTKDFTKYHKGMEIEKLFKSVLDSAFTVHSNLGPGLLESAYEHCLYYELKQKGLDVVRQLPLPLVFKDVKLEAGYRIDLMIERSVVVEIKSIDALGDIHMAQILTYLKLSKCKLGLLANFNVNHFKDGFRRVIN